MYYLFIGQAETACISTAMVATIGGVVIGILGIVYSFITSRQSINRKKIEDEQNEIYRKLNEFYNPYYQLQTMCSELYSIFIKGKRAGFRTLIALLEGEKFKRNDRVLLDEIISIGKKLEKLILDKGGLADDEQIITLLPKATSHFYILRMADEGSLSGELEKYKDRVFPRNILTELNRRIDELKARLIELKKIIILKIIFIIYQSKLFFILPSLFQ